MRHGRRITLFVPETLSTDGSLWRRYVISGAIVRLREKGCEERGEVYLFDRHSMAFSDGMRCDMPKIFPGCAVLTGDTEGIAVGNSLPEGCLKVTSAEHFDSDISAHIKLCLG